MSYKNHDRYEEMKALFNRGLSKSDIGKLYGISRERVRQIIGNGKHQTVIKLPKNFRKIRHLKDCLFFEKVDIRSREECWEWKGAKYPTGYGHCGPKTYSHRKAYEIFFGPIPAGMVVCHKCDNPPCCNPNHLFIGTQTDNMRDRDAKGRGRYGPNSPSKVISVEQPAFMVEFYEEALNVVKV